MLQLLNSYEHNIFFKLDQSDQVGNRRSRCGSPLGLIKEVLGDKQRTALASIRSVQLQQLCKFKAEFGHCRMPQRYAANLKLGHWISTQLSKYRFVRKVGKQVPCHRSTFEYSLVLDSIGGQARLLWHPNIDLTVHDPIFVGSSLATLTIDLEYINASTDMP